MGCYSGKDSGIIMNLIFEVETKYGIFKSSLNVKDGTSPEEIEQIKINLVNSWIEMIENLTDRRYFVSATSSAQIMPGNPRQFLLSTRYRF